jgi:hypothetical protein
VASLQADRPPGKTSFGRALAGYDPEFRRALADKIITVIASASVIEDAPVIAIRTNETLDALADALITTLALVPDMDVPSKLRQAAENLTKRIRREVARARAEGVGDILGAQREGHA